MEDPPKTQSVVVMAHIGFPYFRKFVCCRVLLMSVDAQGIHFLRGVFPRNNDEQRTYVKNSKGRHGRALSMIHQRPSTPRNCPIAVTTGSRLCNRPSIRSMKTRQIECELRKCLFQSFPLRNQASRCLVTGILAMSPSGGRTPSLAHLPAPRSAPYCFIVRYYLLCCS